MSVLQEVEGLTYFIILPVGKPVSMQNFKMYVPFPQTRKCDCLFSVGGCVCIAGVMSLW